ncbi:unnamed protein product [Ceutorhynchus assimilis]|uniref:Myb-binding protein 1A n=1 Tax=Ceutorhynchus assimilis TaxID=467358 RepID=A0A9N9QRQ9_9CUCU|nr:unnamed protein product [Ceutorhynchus assimilis]
MDMEKQAESEIPVETEEKPKKKLVRTVLDNFSKLSNPHENVRVKSAANLLKYLVENSATEEGSNELSYALKRLVRGLGASTPIARAGYYSLLVAILQSKLDVHPDKILEISKTELHKSGKNSDGENADIYTGQILACGAIIKANLWNNIGVENKKEILQILLNACKERSYLGLFGYSFIVELLNLVPEIGTDSEFIMQIQNEVAKPWAEQTLDSLYLLIKLRSASPKIFNKKFVKKSLETPEIICEESLENLCNILMTIPRVTSLKHPIYDVIVDYLNPTILPSFFNELDNHLKTPNRNRLLVFIKILTNTLMQTIKSEEYFSQIAALFTRNFIIQLLGYFRTFKGKQKDKEYHDAIQKLFTKLVELFNKETIKSTVKIAIIKKLLFDPGTFVFEKVTKSKVVQQITLSLDSQGVNDLALVYRGVADGTETINSENESETWLNNDRLYSAHLLIKLLSLPAMRQESDWKVDQLRFLMEISLLRQSSGMNVGRELAESLKTAFFGALDLKLSKLEDLHLILFKLVQSLDEKINTENLEILLRTPVTNETYELWQKTLKTVKKIEKKQKKSGITSVFLTLFLHMGLQLFNDVKLATDSLNELFSCYERVKKDKKAKHALDNTVLEKSLVESEDDPYWVEVVVDLFLNLLSHNSHLLRSIISSVFPHLCKYMTSSTISQILSVLDSKDDENPLSKNDDASSESEDDEQDESGSEEESDQEENGEDVEAEEDDDDDDESDDDTARGKLRMALHQALSNGTNESDDESIDLDQMSDTEGEKLDKALAEAFRQFRPNHGKRKKQTKDQETLTHFRVRVLDLIEIYLDSNPSMLLALEIMLPLLQAVEFSIRDEHQKPLNDRLKSILKKLLGLKKFTDIEGVTDGVLVDLLKSLLDKGNKNVLIVQEMGEQISDCCIFVVKCSDMLRNVEATPSKTKKHLKNKILEVICGELHQFFTQRDSMTPYVLFKSLLQLTWEGNMGLASILLDFTFSSEIRQFKKNQVTELLKIFYSNQRFFSQFKKKVDSKMVEAHKTFSSNVINFFKELCEEPDKRHIKERFICNFFTLLSAMKNSPMEQNNISWSEIATNIREYRSFKSFSKDAKMAFNKLCRVLKVSNIVAMKQNVTKLATLIDNEDEVVSKDEENQPKKKQKRKSNETLKLKKEAKELRLNSLSKGLGQVDFEEAVEINISDIDSSAEESNKTVKDGSDEEQSSHSTKKKKKRKTSEQIDGKNIQINGSMEESKQQEGDSANKKKKRKMSEQINGEHIKLNNSELNNEQESYSTKKKKKSKTSEQTNGDNVQVNGLPEKPIKNKKLLKDGLNMSVNDANLNKKKRVSEGESFKGRRKSIM